MYQRQSQEPGDLSLEDLYRRHARGILRYIQRYVFSIEDADDLLVEVFLAAMNSQTVLNLKEKEQLAWLQRVARNKIIDHQRRVVRRQLVSLEEAMDSPFEEDQFSPESAAVEQEELELLRARLATLPELNRQVLHLRFASGLRTKEIAARLNKSDGAIRSLLLRSLNLLRTLYTPGEEDQING
jgi:RNA polymerase sigma factor (sigma-70 family)